VADRVLNVKVKMTGAVKAQQSLTKIEKSGKKVGGAFAFMKKNWIGVVAGFAAAAMAMRGVINFFKGCIAAANEQEMAINQLNAAMRANGNYTAEASQAVQDYAASLQKQTTYGDEALIQVSATIKAVTKLGNDSLPTATKATLQIAQMFKMNLTSAALLVGKTLTGTTNAFQRYGLEIDMTGDKQERLNELLEKTSAGWTMATAETETQAGRIKQLKNAWGDFKETLGGFITGSDNVTDSIKWLIDKIQEFNDTLKDPTNQAAIRDTVNDLKEIALAVWDIVMVFKPLIEGIGKAFKWFGSLDSQSQNLAIVLGLASAAVFKLAGRFAGLTAMKATIATFGLAGAAAITAIGAAAGITIWKIIDLKNEIMDLIKETKKLRDKAWTMEKQARETSEETGFVPHWMRPPGTKDPGFIGPVQTQNTQPQAPPMGYPAFNELRQAVLSGLSSGGMPELIPLTEDIIKMQGEIQNTLDNTETHLAGITVTLETIPDDLANVLATAAYPDILPGPGVKGTKPGPPKVRTPPSQFDRLEGDLPVTGHLPKPPGVPNLAGLAFANMMARNYRGGSLTPALSRSLGGVASEQVSGIVERAFGDVDTAKMFGESIGAFGGPVGSIIGSLVGSLVGGLFKKKQKMKAVEAISVKDMQMRDLLSQLLNITKSQLNRRGAGGLDRLNNLRLAQQVVA